MTFKHIKFEESTVMRLLERQAAKLGVMADPIVKEASVEIDLSPSNVLIKNIVNLCAGLKAAGFAKHANELEDKFLTFKQAQTLYETSKEKGDDLVNEAHPKGSIKLDGLDGDLAVVETILDQHLKTIKMVNQMPTGKLATSKDVLKAVKFVLGETSTLTEKAKLKVREAWNIFNVTRAKANLNLTFPIHGSNTEASFANAIKSGSVDDIRATIEKVNGWFYMVSPGVVRGVDEDVWMEIGPTKGPIVALLNEALKLRTDAINNVPDAAEKKVETVDESAPVREGVSTVDSPEVTQLFGAMNTALNKLNSWNNIIMGDTSFTDEDKQQARAWILPKWNAINSLKIQFSSLGPSEQVESVSRMISKLNDLLKDNPEFKKLWIG